MNSKLTDLTLSIAVAEFLDWKRSDLIGMTPIYTVYNGHRTMEIPRYALCLDAAMELLQDDRVTDWELSLTGAGIGVAWIWPSRNHSQSEVIPYRASHDATAKGVARAICTAFLEMCRKEVAV